MADSPGVSAADPSAQVVRPRNYSRRRALVLALVYVAIAAHIVHWRLSGRTLAPLELNEVMYTLTEGVITAGFLLMAVACLATAVFGRFFCSWGCHILALEDLSAWLLRKIGVHPRPLRSRWMRFVAPCAALYMFAAPPIFRALRGGGVAEAHTQTDVQGWASFVTNDFWRNLPGPWIAVSTLFACGFLIVYVLGSRSFCAQVCPYGAVFAAFDRIAPGRIVAVGDCSDCGRCTAGCQSHVRVQQELATFGTIVDPACMRDLDCVANCPNQRIRYRFTKPPLLRSLAALRGLPRKWDLGLGEELLLAVVFVGTFFALRGLYDAVPFLLAIGAAVIVSWLAIVALRVLRRAELRFNKLLFRHGGRITRAGWGYVSIVVALLVLVAHSGYVRAHAFLAERALAELDNGGAVGPAEVRARADVAWEHLELCRKAGLIVSPELEANLARVAQLRGDAVGSQTWLRRVLTRAPDDLRARLALGRLLADQGDLRGAAAQFQEAAARHPQSATAHYQLGVLASAEGRTADAMQCFERAAELDPGDADAANNLGFLLMQAGRADAALPHLLRAVERAPAHTAARFNLGRALLERGDAAAAAGHLRAASESDPRYAEAVAALLAQRERR